MAYLFHFQPSEIDAMTDEDLEFWSGIIRRVVEELKKG
jgi:hypothetical protein